MPVPNPARPPAVAPGTHPSQLLPSQSQHPPLTTAQVRNARWAGAVGGGIAWVGAAVAQVAVLLLVVPFAFAAVGGSLFGLFTLALGGTLGDLGGVGGFTVSALLGWFASGPGVAIAVGIPLGVVLLLLGLWISARMLRRGGHARPLGVTLAGFGLSIAAVTALTTVGTEVALALVDAAGDAGSAIDASALLADATEPAALVRPLVPWLIGIALVLLVAATVSSALCWSWMARALRRPAAPQPDVMRPDVMRPDAMRPDAMRPDAMRPDRLTARIRTPEARLPTPEARLQPPWARVR